MLITIIHVISAVVTGIVTIMLYFTPEHFNRDPKITAFCMAGAAFCLTIISFISWHRSEAIQMHAEFDHSILDFLKYHPEYRIEFASGEWSAYSQKSHKACYHKTLRDCLSILRVMHRQTTGWEPRK
ncbi:hypothetical protein KAR91_12420 [Candidatus Pacearchaeota archaeon]|nr:hypothetical protein [Candidatus Pacearchaeota archaeon]